MERRGSDNGTDLLPKVTDWLSQASSTVDFKEFKLRAGLSLKKLWLNAKNVQTYLDKISTLIFYFIILSFWSCTRIRSTVSKHPPELKFCSEVLFVPLLPAFRSPISWASCFLVSRTSRMVMHLRKDEEQLEEPWRRKIRMIKGLKTTVPFGVWLKEWGLLNEERRTERHNVL